MTAYPLPSSLDTAAAAPLRAALIERLDARQPLLLDGSGVERAGLACLQLLAAARTAAEGAALAFEIVEPSEALRNMAALAGLDALLPA